MCMYVCLCVYCNNCLLLDSTNYSCSNFGNAAVVGAYIYSVFSWYIKCVFTVVGCWNVAYLNLYVACTGIMGIFNLGL